MSLVQIEVDADNQLTRQFSDLERKNLLFASVQACNATAWEIRGAWQRTAPRVFDRPTQMTRNAAQFERASRAKPFAVIKLRDEAFKGTPPAKYLLAQVQGGERRRKSFEVLLQARGVMPTGMFAVPGRGAPLDQHGNVRGAELNRILSQLGARRDPYQNETETSRDRRRRRAEKRQQRGGDFFSLAQRRGRLLPGVYERLKSGFGSGVRSIFVFVSSARYQPRYDIFGLAQRTWDRLMPFYFNRELDKAVQTSKFRGRG